MTAAVLDRPGSLFADAAGRGEPSAAGGRMTLEELLNAALHRAHANGSTECPICHAHMASTRARETGGNFAAECGGCGSRLS